jgi:hypothetical protein
MPTWQTAVHSKSDYTKRGETVPQGAVFFNLPGFWVVRLCYNDVNLPRLQDATI